MCLSVSTPGVESSSTLEAKGKAMSAPEKNESGGSGKQWGMVLLLIVVVFSGVLGGLAEQLSRLITSLFGSITNSIGNFLMMLAVNKSAIFLLLAGVVAIRLMTKKKDGGGDHPPKKDEHPPAH